MVNDITQHSGSKYLRMVRGAVNGEPATVDVYAILKAFGVTCPATAHAVKKLLLAGLRGKGSRVQDLREAKDAISRAIEMQMADDGEFPA